MKKLITIKIKQLIRNLDFCRYFDLDEEISTLLRINREKTKQIKNLQNRVKLLEKSQFELSFITYKNKTDISTQKGRITRQTNEQNQEKAILSRWVQKISKKVGVKLECQ